MSASQSKVLVVDLTHCLLSKESLIKKGLDNYIPVKDVGTLPPNIMWLEIPSTTYENGVFVTKLIILEGKFSNLKALARKVYHSKLDYKVKKRIASKSIRKEYDELFDFTLQSLKRGRK